ncbi:MAG TPA: ABC-F family ATP-binding cassette domain-containing protein [Candidatus Polarisedimenticolia bacterium]|jgi:ATP-binding cassette subfamily F protein uup|nr:ABC-F family ATP-binding cassette domain-containing protein [Candidatus Polarisedimenticolia bacterium]
MPPRSLLGCDDLTKAYGAAPLFEGLRFVLHEGDHLGLVGPNGAGKSTLLKILAGVETPDAGVCTRRKGLRVGYVPQVPTFAAGTTVEEVVAAAVAPDGRLDEHERHRIVERALGQAGFTDPALETDVLSGGWRARLAIVRELAQQPDLLLLDEPTNHLDIASIEWLETLLLDDSRAFVVVSHDRYLLENIAGRVLEINRMYPSGLFEVDGSYSDFLEARDTALRHQAAYEETLAGLVRREVAWLRRGAKARTRKSKARIRSAEESIERLAESRARGEVRTTGIDFTASGRRTRRLWAGAGLGAAFGDRTIVDGLDLVLMPGMRLGVIGPNGSGKTTLLRLIVGEIAPVAGTIERAEQLRVVYFEQSRASLDPGLSLKRALAPAGDQVIFRDAPLHVAAWAKRFLFRPEQLETPVSRLSGGERARIVLARMMLEPADLLVLDEPTNDLDIPALEVLEEALLEFPGAIVLVTHDRHLLDRVATRILVLDGRGGATHFADFDQWQAQVQAARPTPRKDEAPALTTREPRRPARRLNYLEQREWDGLEAKVLDAEERLAEARRQADDPAIVADAGELQRRHVALAEVASEVESLYARWAELEAKQKGT